MSVQWRRHCIFCGAGNISKEHFWPKWASSLLPGYPVNQHTEQVYLALGKETPRLSETRSKNGNVWTKKIRVVCRPCNHGWMSALEAEVKPILTPLILGERTQISGSAASTLAKWITLKVLVAECNLEGDNVASKSDREAFRSTLRLPHNFQIWIGRCGVGGWAAAYVRHAAVLSLSPEIKPQHRFKNTHTVSFGIGALFVHVIHTTVGDLSPGMSANHLQFLIPIEPFSGDAVWPPSHALTPLQAAYIANGLNALLQSNHVKWKPLPDNI